MSNHKEQDEAARKITALGVTMVECRADGDTLGYIKALQEIQTLNRELWGKVRNDEDA